MILIYFTISFPYPKEPKEKISISLSALFLSTQKRQKNNSFFEVVSSNESGVWSRTSISGQGPPKGTVLLLERWPRTSRQSDEGSLLFRFAFLLFCLFMVVTHLVLNNHYFSADSSRAEPLEKGKENSPHLLADHFFSPGPRMEIGKAFDSTSGKCFSLPLIVS